MFKKSCLTLSAIYFPVSLDKKQCYANQNRARNSKQIQPIDNLINNLKSLWLVQVCISCPQ